MGKFVFNKTDIDGVYIIEPTVFGDERGYFMETYSETDFAEAGLNYKFVQDNQSSSFKGVLRGLHFQKNHTHQYSADPTQCLLHGLCCQHSRQ